MDSDPLLQPLLGAPESTARERLGELLEQTARPLVRRIVRAQLGRSRVAEEADLEDVESGVLLRLASQLLALRGDGDAPPIASLAGYVAVATYNGCHAFLRRRFPERSRLLARLRYLLTRDERFALWSGPGHEWLAGLAGWRGRPTRPRRAAGERERGPRGGELASVVEETLRAAGGPLRLEELLEAVAGELGAVDAQRHPEAGSSLSLDERLVDPAAPASEWLEQRQYLEHAWREIRQLPRRQRVALLLNLRDAQGGEMLGLLVAAEVAAPKEIAAVLEIAVQELERLWPDLPRDDQWIARFLGLERRQVINLRKCARERLARRLGRP